MRWTLAFDRTHNRIRSPRFETSGQWANVDKGSRQNRLVRDSNCPYLLPSETAAKGTDLAKTAGKEDPVEFDFSMTL